ncbi:MAG: DNA-directed RNA polymerase subunit omega [Planctomycetota bacterium]
MEPRELETLLAKVGGKFKLVTLYQKRMRELQRGLPKLVLADTNNLWDIVSKEIFESKVDLIMGDEALQMRKDLAARESEELAEAEKADRPRLPEKADKADKADKAAGPAK